MIEGATFNRKRPRVPTPLLLAPSGYFLILAPLRSPHSLRRHTVRFDCLFTEAWKLGDLDCFPGDVAVAPPLEDVANLGLGGHLLLCGSLLDAVNASRTPEGPRESSARHSFAVPM